MLHSVLLGINLVLGSISAVIGIAACSFHLIMEFIAKQKHLYVHTTRDFVISLMVFLDLTQIIIREIPVILNYHYQHWVLGPGMCYTAIFFVELTPAQSLFLLSVLLYIELFDKKLSVKQVLISLAIISGIVILFSIPMLLQANHESVIGYAECYVIEDWDGNHWLDYKSYVVTYAVIFLLFPTLGVISVLIFKYRSGEMPSKFLLALAASFTIITLPRLVLEITLILDVWFQFDLWITVHFLCLYRLSSIPFIHLLLPDTLPRIKNVVKGVRSLHRVRYYYSNATTPQTSILNNDDLSNIDRSRSKQNTEDDLSSRQNTKDDLSNRQNTETLQETVPNLVNV